MAEDSGSDKPKKGRPKTEPGAAPLPKGWKAVEKLAGVLAYLEASEAGPNANLEADAKEKYPAQLEYVCTELVPEGFPESKHKWTGHGLYTYDLKESKQRRTSGQTCMVDNFKETRKLCNIVKSFLPPG